MKWVKKLVLEAAHTKQVAAERAALPSLANFQKKPFGYKQVISDENPFLTPLVWVPMLHVERNFILKWLATSRLHTILVNDT